MCLVTNRNEISVDVLKKELYTQTCTQLLKCIWLILSMQKKYNFYWTTHYLWLLCFSLQLMLVLLTLSFVKQNLHLTLSPFTCTNYPLKEPLIHKLFEWEYHVSKLLQNISLNNGLHETQKKFIVVSKGCLQSHPNFSLLIICFYLIIYVILDFTYLLIKIISHKTYLLS